MGPSFLRTSSSSFFDFPPLEPLPFLEGNLEMPFPEDLFPVTTGHETPGNASPADEAAISNVDLWISNLAHGLPNSSTTAATAQVSEGPVPPQLTEATVTVPAAASSPASVSSPIGSSEEQEQSQLPREQATALSLRRKRTLNGTVRNSPSSEDPEIQLSMEMTHKRVTRSAKNHLRAQEVQAQQAATINPIATSRRVVLSEEAQGHAQLWRHVNPSTDLTSLGIFDAPNSRESGTQNPVLLEQVLGIVVVEALTNQTTAQNRIRELEAEVDRLRTENALRAFGIIAPIPFAKLGS